MEVREVTRTGKDKDGGITRLCKPGEHWSPVITAQAITQIKYKMIEYYAVAGLQRSRIEVVEDSEKGDYLRTVADGNTRNNLGELPDC